MEYLTVFIVQQAFPQCSARLLVMRTVTRKTQWTVGRAWTPHCLSCGVVTENRLCSKVTGVSLTWYTWLLQRLDNTYEMCQRISHLLECLGVHRLTLYCYFRQCSRRTKKRRCRNPRRLASYKEARETRDRFISQTSASERIVGRAWPDPHSGQGRWLQCQWATRWVQFKRRSRTN